MTTSMLNRLLCAAGLQLTSAICSASLQAQADNQPTWSDPSPHRVSHIVVAPQVRLEVLDWGGTGAPLIFLAGGGNTAHVPQTRHLRGPLLCRE